MSITSISRQLIEAMTKIFALFYQHFQEMEVAPVLFDFDLASSESSQVVVTVYCVYSAQIECNIRLSSRNWIDLIIIKKL